MPIKRKPLGKIIIKQRHRSNGKVFREGDIIDYYQLYAKNGCACGGEMSLYYKTLSGDIPYKKANKYEI